VSIFGNILSKIFHHDSAGAVSGAGSGGTKTAPSSTPGSGAQASLGSAPAKGTVDVEPVLNNLAAQHKEKLDWRRSIVDLMKLLDLDSSLTARKQLAQELNYTGDTNDSASMNMWLHKKVMQKLAENGGKVPDELKA
jgi:hypothetical protein